MRSTLWSIVFVAACGSSGSGQSSTGPASPGGGVIPAAGITVPPGFAAEVIGTVPGARQLVALPNGDLLVGTLGTSVYLLRGAESTPSVASIYLDAGDAPAQGLAFDQGTNTVFLGTQHGVWSLPYAAGQPAGTPSKIASVRTGGISGTDGDTHTTTSLAVAGGRLYAGVGSSCNACSESDATRAVILEMGLDGRNVTRRATRIRNAIALAANPATGTLWAGGAGQDNLPLGHPFEFFDAVTLHPATADYGWPACEENQLAYLAGSGCSQTVVPLLALPAYSSWIGAVFYPQNQTGAHAFPAANRGLYLAGHGSWHTTGGKYFTPPRVAFVAIANDVPMTPANWSDPSAQFSEFAGGFQLADGTTRIGRPTGIAVGPEGSLFVADDTSNKIYRIRPIP